MNDMDNGPGTGLDPQVIFRDRKVGSGTGLGSIICGVLGIFFYGVVFVPLGAIMAIIAIFKGQVALGIIGLVLAVIGFLSSPVIWGLLGMGAVITWWWS